MNLFLAHLIFRKFIGADVALAQMNDELAQT
jgi:hypothetical protein